MSYILFNEKTSKPFKQKQKSNKKKHGLNKKLNCVFYYDSCIEKSSLPNR